VLANINNVVIPVVEDFDSSEPGNTAEKMDTSRVVALAIILALAILGVVMIARRKT
jgi:hypothetical protein